MTCVQPRWYLVWLRGTQTNYLEKVPNEFLRTKSHNGCLQNFWHYSAADNLPSDKIVQAWHFLSHLKHPGLSFFSPSPTLGKSVTIFCSLAVWMLFKYIYIYKYKYIKNIEKALKWAEEFTDQTAEEKVIISETRKSLLVMKNGGF